MDKLLTRSEVEQRVRIRRSTIYREMRRGEFPTPIRIGAKAVRWKSSEIDHYIENRPRALGDGGVTD